MSFLPGLLLGGLGLLGQSQSNNAQEDIARQQLAQQNALISRQTQLFDALRQIAEQADQQGAFDPNRRLQLLQNQVDYDRNNALNSEAGAARALGYRPGDTAPLDSMNATRGSFDLQLRNLANQVINQSLANKIAAYSAANPSSLNAAMGALGENSRFAIGREIPLGGMLGALAPYLGNSPTSANPAPSTGANPNDSGGWAGLNDFLSANDASQAVANFFGGGYPSDSAPQPSNRAPLPALSNVGGPAPSNVEGQPANAPRPKFQAPTLGFNA